jgi:hypothetical protein
LVQLGGHGRAAVAGIAGTAVAGEGVNGVLLRVKKAAAEDGQEQQSVGRLFRHKEKTLNISDTPKAG